jgi:hypothetical protein
VQVPLGVVPDDHPLAGLIALAQEKSPEERRQWLATMRADAPTLVAQLEQLLAGDVALGRAEPYVGTAPRDPTRAP